MNDPIVITGVGLATCLGLSAEETWRGILAGRRALAPMPALESRPKQDKGGGQAPDLPADFAPDLPREVRYLRLVLREALAQAGLGGVWPFAPGRASCILGTTLHGMRQGGEYLRTGRPEALCSFLATHTLIAALDGISVAGLVTTTCSACSSGLGSIALGATLLESGEADAVICGGYDPVSEYAYAGFDSLRLIDEGAIRPFARGRQGMKVAEGYAIVILERLSSARARWAKAGASTAGVEPLAILAGIGESADAHHLTQPHPEGEGAARAIATALAASGLGPTNIGLISAHATATPNNDDAEHAALARVFGTSLPTIPAVAFKSHLGHTLGGAGAAELILALLAMRDGLAPPTAGVTRDDAEFPDLRLCFDHAAPARIDSTLSTSLGFGGANTCVILRKPAAPPPPSTLRAIAPRPRKVLVTGVGVILPGAIGNEAFLARLAVEGIVADRSLASSGKIDEAAIAHLLNARRVRRLSDYSKLTLAAAAVACADAGIADIQDFASTCSAILGSAHGSAAFCEEYYGQIVKGGIEAANPVLFAEGVPNAAAAQLSLMLGVKGGCQTLIGSRTSGLDALRLAALRIASGLWDRALVSAGEEWTPVLARAYGHRGLCASGATPATSAPGLPYSTSSGFLLGSGAVTLVLESERSASERGARARGAVGPGAWGWAASPERAPEAVGAIAAALQSAEVVIGSGNGTWIDRAEAAGLARSAPGVRATSLAGYFAESFSVGPLASVAAALLSGGAPALIGDGNMLHAGAWRGGKGRRIGVLASDYAGGVTGVVIDARGTAAD
ncbi:MAG: beta-ketoacyl synthase N-terminal-like domain-containing protein [Phycisphaerales bacterium]